MLGNHRTATIINNYIERPNIAAFSVPTGVNKEIRLQPSLVNAFHNLVNEINFSPVKVRTRISLRMMIGGIDQVCMTLRDEYLIANWRSVANVLDCLCRQNFDPHNTNEGLSIKFHVIATVCRRAGNAYDNGDETLAKFLQMLLIGVTPDGMPEG